MNHKIEYLKEPLIEFNHKQNLVAPHDGLSLFGPFDKKLPSSPDKIIYGAIGTPDGLDSLDKFLRIINNYVPTSEDHSDMLWPPFPGFSVAFGAELPNKPAWKKELNEQEIKTLAKHSDEYKRTYDITEKYLEEFSIVKKLDEPFDVIILIVPDIVYKNCRPKSWVRNSHGHRPSKNDREERRKGQRSISEWIDEKFEGWSKNQYELSVDFRRQIKARTMKYQIPIQIIRESTLPPYEDNTTQV